MYLVRQQINNKNIFLQFKAEHTYEVYYELPCQNNRCDNFRQMTLLI